MPKLYLVFPILFLFLITFSMPALAYLPVDLNVTLGSSPIAGNNYWLACSNITGTFYCYSTGTPTGSYPHIYIDRTNETWGDRSYCDSGLSGSTYLAGLFIANSTHIGWIQTGESMRLINIATANWTSHSCPASAQISGFNNTNQEAQAGYVNGLIYVPGTNGIRSSTNNTWYSDSFWDTAYIDTLRFPDQTNDTYLYGTYEELFFEYVNGVFTSNPFQIDTTWDITKAGGMNIYLWDLWKISDSTTWIYFKNGGMGYRANFTQALIYGDTYIVAVNPTGNETLTDSTPDLHAIVYSSYNGTVGWFVDGIFKSNQTITTDGISANAFYTVPAALTEGNHYWKAYWYPSTGYSWDTGTQYFIYSESGYIGDEGTTELKEWLNNGMGSNYGADIVSLIVASVIAVMIFINVKKDDKDPALLFASFLVVASIFSFVGLLTQWFLVLEITIIGVIIFWKTKGG